MAVGGSVAAGAIIESAIRERAANWGPTLPADTVVFDAFFYPEATYPSEATEEVIDVPALPAAPLPDDLRRQVLDIVPEATFLPIRQATIDPAPYDTQIGDGIWPDPTGPRIADSGLLDVLGLAPGDVATLEKTGSVRPLSRWEVANVGEYGYGSSQYAGPAGPIDFIPSTATTAYRYEYAGFVGALVTEAYARELGFDVVERGALVRSPDALTADQRNDLAALRQQLAGQPIDAFVEPGDPPRTDAVDGPTADASWSVSYDEPGYRMIDDSDIWIARAVILGGVLLLTLLVVAIGLSLASAEGRDERNVLAAVGATPASLRRQASARAAVLALGGIVLGIPTGFVPAWMLDSLLDARNAISTEPLRFPWHVTAALVVVVPLLVAGAAWIGSGVGQRVRPPTPTRRD